MRVTKSGTPVTEITRYDEEILSIGEVRREEVAEVFFERGGD